VSYLELVCVDFKGNELGFWLLNLGPIFSRVMHIPISNDFFLDIQMFKFKFKLHVHQIQFKLFGGKYAEV
jgi:hypothetical protein